MVRTIDPTGLVHPQNSYPATGTAYAHYGTTWWSYDTPAVIATKMTWKNQQGLGGTFFRELSGDTSDGEPIKAVDRGPSAPPEHRFEAERPGDPPGRSVFHGGAMLHDHAK